jgi:hypothetical protein
MKVRELVEALQKQDQEAEVIAAVGWAADTAYSDDDEPLAINIVHGRVVVEGWLSNCGTELEIEEEDDDA